MSGIMMSRRTRSGRNSAGAHRLAAVGRRPHVVAVRLERFGDEPPDVRLVVDHEDPLGHLAHSPAGVGGRDAGSHRRRTGGRVSPDAVDAP